MSEKLTQEELAKIFVSAGATSPKLIEALDQIYESEVGALIKTKEGFQARQGRIHMLGELMALFTKK